MNRSATVIDIAIVDDDRMLIGGLRAWTRDSADMRVVGDSPTVAGLLDDVDHAPGVVLLDLRLRDRSDPEHNVRRLVRARCPVLIVSAWAEPGIIAATFAAGASGYLTKDQDLAALDAAIRQVATSLPPEPGPAPRNDRPPLSAREREVLLAYVSGMTLDAVARQLGIKPGTAKTYLDRVKAKYEEAGRPAYTKLDLAERVREDRHSRGRLVVPTPYHDLFEPSLESVRSRTPASRDQRHR